MLLDFPGGARLYRDAREVVEARAPGEVAAALERLRGREAAGFLSYEAGHPLERKLAALEREPAEGDPPLLWFGLFDGWEAVDLNALPDPAGALAGGPVPLVERAAYLEQAERVRAHILAGDVYQINLTFQAEVAVAGHPLALYRALKARARAPWGGVVFTGSHWILSLSPELFFTLDGSQLTARPMKGTAPAGADPEALRGDPKQQAENLMIVDLIRNDLSRVSKPGTVAVPELFAVEQYPTVQQMTSTVVSQLEAGVDAVDVLLATFPCGSVTGAPKIRAMEIIAGLEAGPRGVYTGSIGALAPGGAAAFNVAIRTLTLTAGGGAARMGLGSGIVADSQAADEWRECLAKGAFVEHRRSFDLIETMRFDPHEGLPDLERHLARMKRSADAFGFLFDRHDARNELQAATFALRAPRKVRLMLGRSGAIAIEVRDMPEEAEEPVTVTLAPLPLDAEDFRLRHKTSDRRFYDEAREAADAFEVVFEGADGFLTEGSFTSLFVERDGTLVTPPLERGLLPGILRERLIDEGQAAEGDVRAEDLTGTFFIGNAVRGLIEARLA